MFRLFWKIGLNAVNVDFPNNRSSLYNPNKLQKSYRFSPPFFHPLGQVIDKLRSDQASQKILFLTVSGSTLLRENVFIPVLVYPDFLLALEPGEKN